MAPKRVYAYIGLGVLLLILIASSVAIWIALRTKLETSKDRKDTTSNSKKSLGASEGNDFYVYNYLNKPVQVDIVETHSRIDRKFIQNISPHSRRGIKSSDVVKYLRSGTTLRVFVLDDGKRILFSNYTLDLPGNETIRALHIGMITSKWVGATPDSTFIPPNAIQGRPWIKIHNMTAMDLRINNNISISPYGLFRYTGRDHFGVRLGTIFTDQKGIFPSWTFKIPATDVYWGVVSDLQMPLFAGWQIDSEFTDESDEPQWLLQNGWMGGPAKGKIAPGFIPKDGPATPPLDRWGQLPKLPKVC